MHSSVKNLTYINNNKATDNTILLNNIIEACICSKVSRLIHCSTAAVVGNVEASSVNEETPCNPNTAYEKVKISLENIALSALSSGVDIGILRPTAIVGPRGKNLLKLIHRLKHGSKFVNYLRTCILGSMPMHLVPIEDVSAALLHLATSVTPLNGGIFIISADQDVDNNYRRVEKIVLDALDLKQIAFPCIVPPKSFLSLVFKLTNRNDINMGRVYDSQKLYDHGFKPTGSVKRAIEEFVSFGQRK